VGEGIFAAVVSLLGALLGQARIMSRPDRARKRVQATVELLEALESRPALSEAQGRLLGLIDEQVDYLERVERKVMERRYDPSQLVIGAMFAVPLAYGALQLWELGDWYWKAGAILVWILAAMFVWVGTSGFLKGPRTRAEDHPERTAKA
jgi:hypothetical protein